MNQCEHEAQSHSCIFLMKLEWPLSCANGEVAQIPQPCWNLTANGTLPVFLSAPRTQLVADCSFCQGKIPVPGWERPASSSVTARPLADEKLKIPRYLYRISQEQLVPIRNVDSDSTSNSTLEVYPSSSRSGNIVSVNSWKCTVRPDAYIYRTRNFLFSSKYGNVLDPAVQRGCQYCF